MRTQAESRAARTMASPVWSLAAVFVGTVTLLVGLLVVLVPSDHAGSVTPPPQGWSGGTSPCSSPRLMILSAYPAEMGKIMKATTLDSTEPLRSPAPDSKEYWTGTLEGKPVIEALVGIGPINATHTTADAFTVFPNGCISAIVFSGVAGAGTDASGRQSRIGDVTVPDGWNYGSGPYSGTVDPSMMAVATSVAATVTLEKTTPAGDRACLCVDPGTIPGLTFTYTPTVLLHGEGGTSDPFGGQPAPCLQHGGDLAGCEPCPAALGTSPDPQRFVSGATNPAFLPGLVTGSIGSGGGGSQPFIEGDDETGAVVNVANAHGVPMIGFRGISDGSTDSVISPTGLPDYPSQFVLYDQLAADNSATVALAFVAAWS